MLRFFMIEMDDQEDQGLQTLNNKLQQKELWAKMVRVFKVDQSLLICQITKMEIEEGMIEEIRFDLSIFNVDMI